MDWNGLSDPYCVVKVGHSELRTPCVEKNINPEWEQLLLFKKYTVAKNRVAKIKVMDRDLFKSHDLIGRAELPLPTEFGVEKEELLELEGTDGRAAGLVIVVTCLSS